MIRFEVVVPGVQKVRAHLKIWDPPYRGSPNGPRVVVGKAGVPEGMASVVR